MDLHRVHQETTHINIIWPLNLPGNHLKRTYESSNFKNVNLEKKVNKTSTHVLAIVLPQLHNFQDT